MTFAAPPRERDQPQRSRTQSHNLRERYGTLTHSAFEGVPSPSVTNIMYHPD